VTEAGYLIGFNASLTLT